MTEMVFRSVTETLVFREEAPMSIVIQTPSVVVGPRGEQGQPGPPGPPGEGTFPTALHGGHF